MYGDEVDPEEMAAAQAAMMQEAEYAEAYGQEEDGEGDPMEDPDYYEYDVDQVAA